MYITCASYVYDVLTLGNEQEHIRTFFKAIYDIVTPCQSAMVRFILHGSVLFDSIPYVCMYIRTPIPGGRCLHVGLPLKQLCQFLSSYGHNRINSG